MTACGFPRALLPGLKRLEWDPCRRYLGTPMLMIGDFDHKSVCQSPLPFVYLYSLKLLALVVGVSIQPLSHRSMVPLGAMPYTRGEGASNNPSASDVAGL